MLSTMTVKIHQNLRACKNCRQELTDTDFYSVKTLSARPDLPEEVCKQCHKSKLKALEQSTNQIVLLSKKFLRTHFIKPVGWELTLGQQ